MDTACRTAPLGRQHEVQNTAGSAYVEMDEDWRAANASDKEVSVEHSHAITTMVNNIGVSDIETEGGKDVLSAAMAKIYRRQPEDA